MRSYTNYRWIIKTRQPLAQNGSPCILYASYRILNRITEKNPYYISPWLNLLFAIHSSIIKLIELAILLVLTWLLSQCWYIYLGAQKPIAICKFIRIKILRFNHVSKSVQDIANLWQVIFENKNAKTLDKALIVIILWVAFRWLIINQPWYRINMLCFKKLILK